MKEETVILVIWSQEIVLSGKKMMISTWKMEMNMTMITMVMLLLIDEEEDEE